MSTAGAHANAFYRDVAESRRVWTLRDAGGYPAPLTRNGRRAQPFWSTLSRVERIVSRVAAYRGFSPEELSWEHFRDTVIPDLRASKMLVGVNWSGATATGFDLEPDRVLTSVEQLIVQNEGAAEDREGQPNGGW